MVGPFFAVWRFWENFIIIAAVELLSNSLCVPPYRWRRKLLDVVVSSSLHAGPYASPEIFENLGKDCHHCMDSPFLVGWRFCENFIIIATLSLWVARSVSTCTDGGGCCWMLYPPLSSCSSIYIIPNFWEFRENLVVIAWLAHFLRFGGSDRILSSLKFVALRFWVACSVSMYWVYSGNQKDVWTVCLSRWSKCFVVQKCNLIGFEVGLVFRMHFLSAIFSHSVPPCSALLLFWIDFLVSLPFRCSQIWVCTQLGMLWEILPLLEAFWAWWSDGIFV